MADMSVHVFVDNLRELLKSEHPIIASKRNQLTLQFLYNHVYAMSSFLKKTEDKKCPLDDDDDDDEKVNHLLMEIRGVVLEAENFVDGLVYDAILAGEGCRGVTSNLSVSWESLQKQIEAVKIRVDGMNTYDQTKDKMIQKKMTTSNISDEHKTWRRREYDSEEAVFGIDETIQEILAGLVDAADKSMQVISVVGLPGIGKTTLARQVFDHVRTRSNFQIRAWVTVSQTYDPRCLLIDILKSASLFEDGDQQSTADKLGENLLKRFKDKKYLLVLDDIWSINAWNDIQRCFPNQHNGSRVLFTSRSTAVGKDVCRDINTHNLIGLSGEDSWNLLKNKVFGDQRQCPPDLEESGVEIARKCDGLPLAIVVTGGVLAKRAKTPQFWEQVACRLAPAIATDRDAYMDTLSLSYQNLPIHLKACFLYLGLFPEDCEIPMRRLVCLLVAEGFVVHDELDQSSLLEVRAEGYLNELVERSLVTVARKRPCGATKTLRIHDLLRDFCIVRGQQEKFLGTHSGNLEEYSSSWETTLKEERRLHLQSADKYHFQDRLVTSNLRSFCGSGFECNEDYVAAIFAHSFRFLKVLDLGEVRCRCLTGMAVFVHLRYLEVSFGGYFDVSITKLLNLETLRLLDSEDLELPDEVWNMVKLRHLFKPFGIFHFKAPTCLHKSSLLGNLQTLRGLCGCQSCRNMLVRTPALRNLRFKWASRTLAKASSSSSCCSAVPDLGFLTQLETLVFGGSLEIPRWSNVVAKLQLPTFLKKLTLAETYLKWVEISSCFAELENLEVLNLLIGATADDYENASWDTTEVEFPKLKYLKMEGQGLHKWEDQNLQFESLEVLVLDWCYYLETIPLDLALSPSLHTIEVKRCTAAVGILAKEIEEEHENQCGNSNLRVFVEHDGDSDNDNDNDNDGDDNGEEENEDEDGVGDHDDDSDD